MSLITIVILLFLGIVFLLLEILVFPGTGITGVIGLLLLAASVWQIYVMYGNSAGHIALASTSVICIAAIIVALQPKTWNRASLKSEISGTAVPKHSNLNVGDNGTTLSRLAPMGKARFGNESYEVRTFGSMINEKVRISIVKIENNSIYVKELNEK